MSDAIIYLENYLQQPKAMLGVERLALEACLRYLRRVQLRAEIAQSLSRRGDFKQSDSLVNQCIQSAEKINSEILRD